MKKSGISFIIISITAIFLALSFFVPQTVLAANTNCDPTSAGLKIGDCLQLSEGQPVSSVYDKPAVLVNLLTSNIFIAGGIILLVMIIYAGFQFITGGAKGMEQAKSVLGTALMGFIIMFMAYWILRIIKIITGANILF